MGKNKFILFFLILIISSFAGCKTNRDLPKNSINNPSTNNEQVKKSSEAQEKVPAPPPPKVEPKSESKTEPKPEPKPEAPKSENKVLASFNTTILDEDQNRVDNIRLASQKINGFVLNPGEVFSFNKVVGKRDYNKGYKKAKILINGEANEDVGGGICQLSSTIYNAALKSGMEIIERHTHSGEVGYIARGQDAAVSYGYKDLKFKNVNDYPVKFVVSIKGGKVYVSTIKII